MSHLGSCRSRWISCQLGLRPSIIWSRSVIFYLLTRSFCFVQSKLVNNCKNCVHFFYPFLMNYFAKAVQHVHTRLVHRVETLVHVNVVGIRMACVLRRLHNDVRRQVPSEYLNAYKKGSHFKIFPRYYSRRRMTCSAKYVNFREIVGMENIFYEKCA